MRYSIDHHTKVEAGPVKYRSNGWTINASTDETDLNLFRSVEEQCPTTSMHNNEDVSKGCNPENHKKRTGTSTDEHRQLRRNAETGELVSYIRLCFDLLDLRRLESLSVLLLDFQLLDGFELRAILRDRHSDHCICTTHLLIQIPDFLRDGIQGAIGGTRSGRHRAVGGRLRTVAVAVRLDLHRWPGWSADNTVLLLSTLLLTAALVLITVAHWGRGSWCTGNMASGDPARCRAATHTAVGCRAGARGVLTPQIRGRRLETASARGTVSTGRPRRCGLCDRSVLCYTGRWSGRSRNTLREGRRQVNMCRPP